MMIVYRKRNLTTCFTLVELMIVTAILTLLISLFMPALNTLVYKSQNLQCVKNQKGIVVTVMMYTSDNYDYYPYGPESDTNSMIAPTILIHKGRGLDYKNSLAPYFSPDLKSNLICQRAAESYQPGGAVRYSQAKVDMDTDTGEYYMTSYSHFYGRNVSGVNDTGWGSGSVFFAVTQGKVRVGDDQKFNCYNDDYDDIAFNIMTSDVMWRWNDIRNWIHNTPGATPEGLGSYMENLSTQHQLLDFNYSLDNGSVKMMSDVLMGTNLDERIASSSWKSNRGWVLPLPNHE
jgi:hypothetical protein